MYGTRKPTFVIPQENATAYVVDRLCRSSPPGNVKSWMRVVGTKLPLTTPLNWDQQKAVLILAGVIVDKIYSTQRDAIGAKEKIADFLQEVGLEEYLQKEQGAVLGNILTLHPKLDPVGNFGLVDKFQVCKRQYERAPLWNLDLVAPNIYSTDRRVKRIVLQQRGLRELISTNKNLKDPTWIKFDYNAQKVLESVSDSLSSLATSSLAMLRLEPLDGTHVSTWTNAFVGAVVSETDLFAIDLPGHATVRVNFAATNSATNLKLYWNLGRVLGLMLVREVALENIFFQRAFYTFLVGEKLSVEAVRPDYPQQYALLYRALLDGEDIRTQRDVLMKPLTDQEKDFLSNYKLTDNIDMAKGLTWFYAEGRSGQAFERMRDGFWEVVPSSLKGKMTSTDIRHVMTERAAVVASELQRAVQYDGLTVDSEVVKHFWSIANESGFPITKLLVELTGSWQVPIGGFRLGHPHLVISGRSDGFLTLVAANNQLCLPLGLQPDQLRTVLLAWLNQ